jgi:hypothetical protein
MSSLRRHFTIAEEYSYGSILHLALHDIAHNFTADDPATARWSSNTSPRRSRHSHGSAMTSCSPCTAPATSQAQDLRPNASPPEKAPLN